jgi:YVTN family beta-propeller protein
MRINMLVVAVALAAVHLNLALADMRRLPTGQLLTPVGTSIPLDGTMAENAVRIPNKPWIAVVCSGARQSLSIVDVDAQKVLSSVQYQALDSFKGTYVPTGSVYYGLAVSPDGETLYAARGSEDKISSYSIGSDGSLKLLADYDEPVANPKASNFPSGVAIDPASGMLFAANNMSDTLAVFSATSPGTAPALYPIHSYPLAVALDSQSNKLYVSSERDSSLSVYPEGPSPKISSIAVGSHPDALLLTADDKYLYVANGDSDSISIVDTATDTVIQTLLLRPAAVSGLPGATPTGLALSPDEHELYVTLADMNAVAVVRLAETRSDGRVLGYIPTGWYPTAVTVSPNGNELVVVNAKGSTPKMPNPGGQSPIYPSNQFKDHYILTSTVSIIPIPSSKKLAEDTRRTLIDNAVTNPIDRDAESNFKLLSNLPIKHIIYIIKENRTYDEVLGDMAQGNGDPHLTLFGQSVTPNQHAICNQFVLMDNFYVCAEVSPDGWNWSTSGFAEEYVQRSVPENYSEDKKTPRRVARSYDYEGENRDLAVSDRGISDVATSPGGYIWDEFAKEGLSYRNYGSFLSEDGDRPAKPALINHTSPLYAPFDMKYADSDVYAVNGLLSPGQSKYVPKDIPSRYTAWKTEFDHFVQDDQLPAFELIRLPRDHTAGTTPGLNTPQAMAADNDYAVGEICQAVSHSPYWKDTAIFVLEDDAQNGPDHVDCHRSTAYIISPYIKRSLVDHHFYNTDSFLRTMEILLHVPPMTRLDASAPPMGSFTKKPDLTPFNAIVPEFTLVTAVNPGNAVDAALSKKMNFAIADDAPDMLLNEVLWHSIKGNIPMPQPRNSTLAE